MAKNSDPNMLPDDITRHPYYDKWLLLDHPNTPRETKTQIRNFLAEAYMPLVENAARKALKKRPAGFELSDLVSAGSVGLLQAIDKFDISRGILFSTFAPRRIYGSIIDEINSMDWTPRTVREKIRQVLQIIENSHHEGKHELVDAEAISKKSKEHGHYLTEHQVNEILRQKQKTFIRSIDHESVLWAEENGTVNPVNHIHAEPSIEEQVHQLIQVKELIKTIRSTCTPDEQKVLFQAFYLERTVKDISRSLGLPPSTVSTLKKSALKKIQDKLTAPE